MAHKRSLMSRASVAGARASARSRAALVVLLLLVASGISMVRAEGNARVGMFEMSADGMTVIVRLRSFAPRASGRLEVEPTAGGGRVRLTAMNLPPPQKFAPHARTFVAWASGGRILRLGELRRGARGAGSLVFTHPSEFARYSLIVTAEADARPERPTGAPLFSTRANEVAALFPIKDDARETAGRERRAATRRAAPPAAAAAPAATAPRRTGATATAGTNAPPRAATPAATAATTLRTTGAARARGSEGAFFNEIDEAIRRDASARTLTLVGDRGARGARGTARVATEDGTAYVRVRFHRVPPASRFGRGRRYAMWALIPEDMGTVYMGSLPARDLNRLQTYARTEGVRSGKFRLLVTAERHAAASAPRPRGRRVLMTFKGRRRK
ncbi:MAG TPA: hypothetical protein VER76_10565 [Pyrinomonadaceae bacterium]|nr:hypothetical protein [Pyrinomonadaceae bacterium]